MILQLILIALFGIIVGLGASFSGLGGGFLLVPLLMFMGYSAQQAVGTSFLGISIISVSALAAHGKLAQVDYRTGVVLGIGGLIGARLIEQISTANFKKLFAAVLVGLAAYLFLQK